jgi:DNA-binding SARP family transcriptional activator
MLSADHRGNWEQRWRLLGPMEVRTPDGWTGVSAPKLRVLLAVLLAPPGKVVSTERLISELWADVDPPAGCRRLVSQYVFRLRRLMGDPAGRVGHTPPRPVTPAGPTPAWLHG